MDDSDMEILGIPVDKRKNGARPSSVAAPHIRLIHTLCIFSVVIDAIKRAIDIVLFLMRINHLTS